MTTEQSRRALERKKARAQLTAANGGVAPVEVHDEHTYKNWDCRCPTCRAANTRKQAGRRAERYARTAENGGVAPVEVHGLSTYQSWGCRCRTCRLARSAAKAVERRAQERERTDR